MNFLFDAQDVKLEDFKTKLTALLDEAGKKMGKTIDEYAKDTRTAINSIETCAGSMGEPKVVHNHATIGPLVEDGKKCLLGTSNVKMTMLRDFGGN